MATAPPMPIKPKGDVFLQQIDLTELEHDECFGSDPESGLSGQTMPTSASRRPRHISKGRGWRRSARGTACSTPPSTRTTPSPRSAGYRTGVAYADSMAGPWRRTRAVRVFFGGHLSVFDGPDGRKWFSYRNEQGPKNHGLLCIDPIDLDAQGHVQSHGTLGRTDAPPAAWPAGQARIPCRPVSTPKPAASA